MRDSVKEFVKIAVRTLVLNEPIYEFGAFLVKDQLEIANLRPLFPNKIYVGCDMREGPGVDKILNLHEIDLPEKTAGTVMCFDTLEHVEYPHKAMQELHRILKPNGIALISSVMNYPIHDHPCDYWRFTPEAFRSIMTPFQSVYVQYAGLESFPHTVIGVGFKEAHEFPGSFTAQMTEWKDAWTEAESPRDFKGKFKREIRRILKQIKGKF